MRGQSRNLIRLKSSKSQTVAYDIFKNNEPHQNFKSQTLKKPYINKQGHNKKLLTPQLNQDNITLRNLNSESGAENDKLINKLNQQDMIQKYDVLSHKYKQLKKENYDMSQKIEVMKENQEITNRMCVPKETIRHIQDSEKKYLKNRIEQIQEECRILIEDRDTKIYGQTIQIELLTGQIQILDKKVNNLQIKMGVMANNAIEQAKLLELEQEKDQRSVGIQCNKQADDLQFYHMFQDDMKIDSFIQVNKSVSESPRIQEEPVFVQNSDEQVQGRIPNFNKPSIFSSMVVMSQAAKKNQDKPPSHSRTKTIVEKDQKKEISKQIMDMTVKLIPNNIYKEVQANLKIIIIQIDGQEDLTKFVKNQQFKEIFDRTTQLYDKSIQKYSSTVFQQQKVSENVELQKLKDLENHFLAYISLAQIMVKFYKQACLNCDKQVQDAMQMFNQLCEQMENDQRRKSKKSKK